ncbi:MAG TPA: ABC transporter ATP-binding protein [bacterium]|nr:ABC transporter ATP-binding protein [bacterium]
MNIIRISNLNYKIDNISILTDINFSIQQGEMFAVIGPNGAGKSTLLKLLCGLIHGKLSGEIFIKDRLIEKYSQLEISKIIAYIPQILEAKNFYGWTVFDYVLTGRFRFLDRLNGFTKNDYDTVEHILAALQITKFKDRYLSTLSGGELQKTLLAAALAQDTEIILLDEFSNFLDLYHKLELDEFIKKLNLQGKTIISVTHNINDAVRFSNRILVLKYGKQYYCGAPRDFIFSKTAEKVFNVKFEKITYSFNNNTVPIFL